ncbi:hypothetical protein [Spongiibacter marinus]|uniref:hypothetical protein n=1 Tax=Spongiibacter marinus TaxID=354246 RepID=UPI00195FF4E2|nr:hypothetical protein [Spongiibacter marinus]MBM7424644.1 MFS family permease [Spongiibacter marinus]
MKSLALLTPFLYLITVLSKILLLQNPVSYVLLTLILGAPLLAASIAKRRFLIAFFTILHWEVLLVIWVKYLLFGSVPDSWRAIFYSEKVVGDAALITAIFLDLVYVVFSLVLIAKDEGHVRRKRILLEKIRDTDTFKVELISVGGIIFCLVYALTDLKFVLYGKIGYTQMVSGFPFLELYQLIGYISIFNFSAIYARRSGKVFLLLYGLMLLALLFSGFRGVFVGLAIFSFCVYYTYAKPNVTRLVLIGVVAIFVLNIVAVTRVGFDSAGGGVLSRFGSHEENEFFTLVATMEKKAEVEKNTYLMSLCRQVPFSALFLGGEACDRSSVYMGGYILPVSILESGINMGAFSLAEAVFNYGIDGGVLFLCGVALLVVFFEVKSKNNEVWMSIAYLLAAQSYTFAYYGSSNFFAMIVPAILMFFLYSFFRRIKQS